MSAHAVHCHSSRQQAQREEADRGPPGGGFEWEWADCQGEDEKQSAKRRTVLDNRRTLHRLRVPSARQNSGSTRTCVRLGQPAQPAVPAYPSISAKFTDTRREQPASSIVTP